LNLATIARESKLALLWLLALFCAAGAGADLDRARELLRRGAIAEAVKLLRQHVQHAPGDADGHLLLGSALALVPLRSEAIDEARRAVELRPKSAGSYEALGSVLARFAEYPAARQAFEKALDLDPASVDTRYSLALVLAQLSEYAAAEGHLRRAVELAADTPRSANLHFLLGRILSALDKPGEAAAECERAINLRPDYADAYVELAAARRKLLDEAGSFQALYRAVELAPNNAEAQYRLGMEYHGKDQGDKALEHLRVAYGLTPGDRRIVYNYALALRLYGNSEEADVVSRRLMETVKSSVGATDSALDAERLTNEGVELEKRGDTLSAIARYRAALEIKPLEVLVRRNLGLALCRAGHFDQGIRELKEALRLDPNDAATTQALYIAIDQAASSRAGTAGRPKEDAPK
jgi:tetratricopeptide (TPR) repeat protein